MLTATGIGSGLDIEGLVTQLVAAERTPVETRLVRQETRLTAQLSAFGSFQGALSSLQTSLSELNQLSTFGQRNATSSDQDIIAVSADQNAEAASYDVSVSQLATTHSLASGSFASRTAEVGSGTLTIRFGTTDYTSPTPGPESYNSFTVNSEKGVASITIDSSNNTLEGVRDAINGAGAGVSAVIVQDGSGFRLLLSSDDSGAANSLEVTVDDNGDGNDLDSAGLSALAFNSGATNLDQTVAAQDARFSVNGLSISSGSNTASEVIDGVELELKGVTDTSPVTISVSEDRDSVRNAITGFVSGYNSFITTVNNLTRFDPETEIAGPLQGDFSARSISSQLRQALAGAVEGFDGPFSSLSEIGITTQADGTLSTDSTRLDEALEENFDVISGLFTAVGFASESSVSFVSSSDNTAVGEFAVNITRVATQGQLTGSAVSFPLDINADNDSLSLRVNGAESGAIVLTRGSYASGADLAAELQSRINGDSNLSERGIRVAVSFDSGRFAITSDSFGSESTVEITAADTNTSAELGLAVGAGTAGVDVAGTIGGVAATGIGKLLTGAEGSNAEGLRLTINGTATGSRGTVDFSQGIAYQVNALITSFLGSESPLGSRTDGIQGQIDGITEQRETLDRRLEALEARFRSQFNSLDRLLSELQGTSNFLTQQLASLPRAGALVGNNN